MNARHAAIEGRANVNRYRNLKYYHDMYGLRLEFFESILCSSIYHSRSFITDELRSNFVLQPTYVSRIVLSKFRAILFDAGVFDL